MRGRDFTMRSWFQRRWTYTHTNMNHKLPEVYWHSILQCIHRTKRIKHQKHRMSIQPLLIATQSIKILCDGLNMLQPNWGTRIASPNGSEIDCFPSEVNLRNECLKPPRRILYKPNHRKKYVLRCSMVTSLNPNQGTTLRCFLNFSIAAFAPASSGQLFFREGSGSMSSTPHWLSNDFGPDFMMSNMSTILIFQKLAWQGSKEGVNTMTKWLNVPVASIRPKQKISTLVS